TRRTLATPTDIPRPYRDEKAPARTIRQVELMIYPDGPVYEVADEQDALARGLEGQLVLDGTRFLRRDVTGAPVGFVPRPPVAQALDLLPHPEGGWFRETWRSAVTFRPEGYEGARASAT